MALLSSKGRNSKAETRSPRETGPTVLALRGPSRRCQPGKEVAAPGGGRDAQQEQLSVGTHAAFPLGAPCFGG